MKIFNLSICIIAWFSAIFPVVAQDEGIELIRVEYWYPVEGKGKWVRIKEDGLSNVEISEANKTKTWVLNNNGTVTKKPVAYVSGSTPRIGACFRKLGANNSCSGPGNQPIGVQYYAKGEALDQNGAPLDMLFPAKQLVKAGSSKTYEYTAEAASSSFQPEQVRYFEKFKIKWQWALDLNGPWNDAGTSENRLYVTHKEAISEDDLSAPFFYTSLHLGCKLGNTKSMEPDIFGAIFAEFATKCVKRVDDSENNCLKYWGDPVLTRQNRGLEYLLENANGNAYEDGRCGDWVDFFKSILYVQGFSGNQITALAYNPAGSVGVFNNSLEDTYLVAAEQFFGNALFPTPNDPDNPSNLLLDNADPEQNLPGSGTRLILHGTKATNSQTGLQELVIISQFFVKSWNFSNGENTFYALLPDGANLDIQNPNGSIAQTITGADVNGLSAQGGGGNPVSNFDDHVLYKYDNQYYDPSYGEGGFADKAAWVTESLSGYGTILTYIAPNTARYKIIWLDQSTDASNTDIIQFKVN